MTTLTDIQIRQRCLELAEFLISKNNAYGQSVSDPVCIFSHATPLERLYTRMDDKLSRIARGQAIANTDEPLDDTKRDLAGYLVLESLVSKVPTWRP